MLDSLKNNKSIKKQPIQRILSPYSKTRSFKEIDPLVISVTLLNLKKKLYSQHTFLS